MTGRSELGLELASIQFQGKTYNVVSSDVKQSGTSRGKQTAERVGGGAALGALIGAIAGGGKGAAIGAAELAAALTALRSGMWLQSSIRSRWADQSVVRGSGAQSSGRPSAFSWGGQT